MTLEEVEKLSKKIKKEILTKYKEIKEKIDNNDFVYDNINEEQYMEVENVLSNCFYPGRKKINVFFNLKIFKSSELENNYSLTDVKKIIKEFELELNKLKENKYNIFDEKAIPKLVVEEVEFVDDDYEISDVYFKQDFYSLKQEQQIRDYIDKKIRKTLEEKLKPLDATYTKPIDCKLFELFRRGNIDWQTLQEMNYKNCNI